MLNHSSTIFIQDVSASANDSMHWNGVLTTKYGCSLHIMEKYLQYLSKSCKGTEFNVVTFGHIVGWNLEPKIASWLNITKEMKQLKSLFPGVGGATAIAGGIKKAIELVAQIPSNRYVQAILLTDGWETESTESYVLQTAMRLKQLGVILRVVGVGNAPQDVNEQLLRRIASPGEYIFCKDTRLSITKVTLKTLTIRTLWI